MDDKCREKLEAAQYNGLEHILHLPSTQPEIIFSPDLRQQWKVQKIWNLPRSILDAATCVLGCRMFLARPWGTDDKEIRGHTA